MSRATLIGVETVQEARRAIERGADINEIFHWYTTSESFYGAQHGYYTPLYNACEMGCIEVAHFLMEQGADVNIVCGGNMTALEAAISGFHEDPHYENRPVYAEIIEDLIRHNAKYTNVKYDIAKESGIMSILLRACTPGPDFMNKIQSNGYPADFVRPFRERFEEIERRKALSRARRENAGR